MKIFENHPDFPKVKEVCERLQSAGFKAYLAGGCVRDFLLGRTPNDFDVASDALPEQVEGLFKETHSVGKAFGVIVVVMEGVPFEVTRFRADGLYVDGRRPISVTFSSEKEDAARRDFTMNALFMDPFTGKIIDHFSGQADIDQRIIKAVGDPQLRLSEDALRILRAYRFASQLGFSIESKTRQACRDNLGLLKKVSIERVLTEIQKLLRGDYFAQVLEQMHQEQVLEGILQRILSQISGGGQEEDISLGLSEKLMKIYPMVPDLELDLRWPLFLSRLFEVAAESVPIAISLVSFSRALKISKEDERSVAIILSIDSSLSIVDREGYFSKLSSCLFAPIAQSYFAFLSRQNLEHRSAHQHLVESIQIFTQNQGKAPPPVLKAQDFPDLKGASLGEVLKKAYLLQLLNPGLDRDRLLRKINESNGAPN